MIRWIDQILPGLFYNYLPETVSLDRPTSQSSSSGRGSQDPAQDHYTEQYLQAGQTLYFRGDKTRLAVIKPDGSLRTPDGFEGSIHGAGSHYMDGAPCNGWDTWYLEVKKKMVRQGEFRERYREEKATEEG